MTPAHSDTGNKEITMFMLPPTNAEYMMALAQELFCVGVALVVVIIAVASTIVGALKHSQGDSTPTTEEEMYEDCQEGWQ